jgi:hypothetical protein
VNKVDTSIFSKLKLFSLGAVYKAANEDGDMCYAWKPFSMISVDLNPAMNQCLLSTSFVDEQSQPEIAPNGQARLSKTVAPAVCGALSERDARRPRRKRNLLSCIDCRRKKVKCDRANPCSRCVRVGAICVSSQPSGAPRGRNGGRRKVHQEVLDRIAKLENLVKGIEGRNSGESTAGTVLAHENRAV